MTGNWIVHGDATTSGGRMISSSPFTDVDGKGVCRKGDKATCPKHKGVFPITGGYDPTTIIDDQEVALHGATLACSCKVLSTQQMRVFLDAGASVGEVGSSAAAQLVTALTQAAAGGLLSYDEAFVLRSELTGEPLANRGYRLVREDGSVEEGTTDAEGLSALASSDVPEVVRIEIAEEEANA